jgi:uncharacterized protein YceK
VLYSFPGGVEAPTVPYSGVMIGPGEALYGTAYISHYETGFSTDGGAVFMLTPPSASGGSWTESTLLNFWTVGDLGSNPAAGVVSVGGSFYGTTYFTNQLGGCGSVYELSPPTASGGAWTGTEIHSFGGGSDGCGSVAPLTAGPGGVLYGTTLDGGSAAPCLINFGGCGTVFQLTPPTTPGGAWTETVIYAFTGANGDGALPSAGVVLGGNGVLYGTTGYGGSSTSGSPCTTYGVPGCGTVFALTPPATSGGVWTETVLHSFTGQNGDGGNPGPLVLSSSGVLYGPATSGGTAGAGTIFAVKP